MTTVLIGEVLLWIAAVLTLVTGFDYLRLALKHVDGSPPESVPEPSATPRATDASRASAAR